MQNGTVVSEKILFKFLYVHNLRQRSRNDLDLQYSHTWMKSISCLYLPAFRSQASIISEKFTVFTFSYRKTSVSKFDLALKKVKITPGSSFVLWWAGVPDATYPVLSKSDCVFQRRRFLKGFNHIWVWQPSWSCNPHAANKFSFPLPKEAPHTIWLWSAKRFLRRCLSIVDARWTDNDDGGRTPDHGYTISSHMSLWLRWAKNEGA